VKWRVGQYVRFAFDPGVLNLNHVGDFKYEKNMVLRITRVDGSYIYIDKGHYKDLSWTTDWFELIGPDIQYQSCVTTLP
jgi:hypothetical protein